MLLLGIPPHKREKKQGNFLRNMPKKGRDLYFAAPDSMQEQCKYCYSKYSDIHGNFVCNSPTQT